TAQPWPSRTAQTLMWASVAGSGNRSHSTPGATSRASPCAGGSPQGKRSAAAAGAASPLSAMAFHSCSRGAVALVLLRLRLPPQDLARGGLGQRVDKLDHPGHLVGRHPLARPLDQL